VRDLRIYGITVAWVGAAALVAALPGAAASGTLVATLKEVPTTGQEGPGLALIFKLTSNGNKFSRLTSGTYTFVVNDQSKVLNFHLTGPGGAEVRTAGRGGRSRVATGVQWRGTATFVVRLRNGVYEYFSDPHASSIRGSFRVV
jgi:hypothetical protein